MTHRWGKGRKSGDMSEPAASGTGDPAPRRVLVAGDWHGDREWALNVIMRVPQLLAGEQKRLILQLGDFGIWRDADGRRYLGSVTAVLDTVDAELWFIDGNHEDFTELARMASGGTLPDGRVVVRPNIYHLPRGYRWRWHGRTWLACGGAVSLDRAQRFEGRDWWPDEEITRWEETAIIASGHADVLMCHDCPSGVEHRFPRPLAGWAPEDQSRAQAHRERLQRITDAVTPTHLMHGHLHRAYQRSCDFGYGAVQVTGLATDGVLRNFAVLDTELMTWSLRRRGLLDVIARQ